ncbi:hypothetical protein GQ44DRAFT_824608 [Phaeosphaeriaceae sp. PMI808]|nr:hypothetical protein GQ44DRAFT_824608 [Phaeosphaeriaceae sp. PMI808]
MSESVAEEQISMDATGKRAAEPSESDSHKKRKLGFAALLNSSTFSDITIRYGQTGELEFKAHKSILIGASYWFQAAFMSEFRERSAKELRLYDDDSFALKFALESAYNNPIEMPTTKLVVVDMIVCIEVYRVADKYGFPTLQEEAHQAFRKCIERLWDEEKPNVTGFCDVLKKLYELPGADIGHPMVCTMLEPLDSILLSTTVTQTSLLLLLASKDAANFGRDVVLRLAKLCEITVDKNTGKPRCKYELGLITNVTCPRCKTVWQMTVSRAKCRGCCVQCGKMAQNWWSNRTDKDPMDP